MSTNQAELCDILDKHQFDQNKLKHYLADKLPDIDDNLSILQFQGGGSLTQLFYWKLQAINMY